MRVTDGAILFNASITALAPFPQMCFENFVNPNPINFVTWIVSFDALWNVLSLMVVFAQTSKKIEQSTVPAFPTFISHRFYAIWKHLRTSIPRNEANDQLILKFFQASEIPSDVKVFTDAVHLRSIIASKSRIST